nr:hypothetical protein [Tanacetum cinerariifolium]
MYHPQRASPPQNQSSPMKVFNFNDDNLKPLWAFAPQPSQYMKDDNLSRRVTKSSLLWTIEGDVALCKACISASEDSIEGNGKKSSGFWTEVTEYFHKKMGEQKRSYDSVNCKRKDRIRPKTILNGKKLKCQSFINPKIILQKIEDTETTSQGNSDSAHIERELELEDQKRQEQGELKRLKIEKRDKELDLQQKMFEFQQQQKWEEDIKYYNEDLEHLTGRALSTTLLLKKNQRAITICNV